VDAAVTEKRRLYMEMDKAKIEEEKRRSEVGNKFKRSDKKKAIDAKQAYHEANKKSKKLIAKAKEAERNALGSHWCERKAGESYLRW